MTGYAADKYGKGPVRGMFPSVESAGAQAGYPILDTYLQATESSLLAVKSMKSVKELS